ncbi:MAG: XRE family transcriptional regulator [Oscillospiraceae bacterium]|nr:XRE family transcriptional regulator [Oscillospiraceae bacterium]
MNGAKIRQLRLAKGMTLQELARQTQTTAGYLSQLERDLVDPSLSTLRKVAQVLNTPLFSLVDSQDDAVRIVRSGKRQKIAFADSNVILEVLTPKSESTPEEVFVLTFALGAQKWSNDERVSHNVDECFYAQKGELEVLIGDATYFLHEGDSIYIRANTPHNIYNPGPETAVGISALSSGFFVSVARP